MMNNEVKKRMIATDCTEKEIITQGLCASVANLTLLFLQKAGLN